MKKLKIRGRSFGSEAALRDHRDSARKAYCRANVFDFLVRVINGDESEDRVCGGVVISVGASIADRLRAAEFLRDVGFGRPTQAVDVISDGGPVAFSVVVHESTCQPS